MELPQLSDFTPEELRSKLLIHQNDILLPSFYRQPLGEIVKLINQLPPTKRNVHDHPIRLTNWNELYDGYLVWGIPDDADDEEYDEELNRQYMQRKLQLQFWYPKHSYPEIQLGKKLSVAFQRRLKAFSKTPDFKDLGKNIYVLKVELIPKHTSLKEDLFDRLEDPVVCWRLLTCFGDTNLNAFHDQILAPAMGWRRNFHAYRYTVPTNGASIFPHDTSAMDRMHLTFNAPTFSLDTKKYDVRHLLRKQGDRLVYNYDMGDNWCHVIKVLSIQDMGTTLRGADMKNLDAQVFKAVGKKEWKLQCSSLLWGEINCPPENSEGCEDGLGRYGSILKKGPDYEVPDAHNIINWNDHDIQYAYDFDLEAHLERFKAANAGRQNPRDGVLQFYQEPPAGLGSGIPFQSEDLLAMAGGGARSSKSKITKVNMDDKSTETVRIKEVTTSKCTIVAR